MADETPGGGGGGAIPVGGIYATVKIDATNVPQELESVRAVLAMTDREFAKLATTATAAMRDIAAETRREVEQNLREVQRQAEERAATIARTTAAELKSDREIQRSRNEALAADIQARAAAADRRAADHARANAEELAADRALQRARNEMLAADIQRRHDAPAATYEFATEQGISRAQRYNEAIHGYAVQAPVAASAASQFFASLQKTNKASDEAEKLTVRQVAGLDQYAGATNRGTEAGKQSRYALFQVAYAMDDIQYGLPALTNNIVGLAVAMGGNSGFAGQAAIVVTGLVLAYKAFQNFDHIAGAVNSVVLTGIDQTRTHAQVIEELGKKTNKTTEETQRYNAAKERQKEIEEALSVAGNDPRSQKEAVQAALAEAGGGRKVVGKLAEVMGANSALGRDDGLAQEEEGLKKKIAASRSIAVAMFGELGRLMPIAAEKQLKELQEKAEKQRQENLDAMAKDLIAEAQTDPQKLKALIGYVEKNRGSFGPELQRMLESSFPEVIKANKERDEAIREDESENKKRSDETKARQKRQAQEIAKDAIPGSIDIKAIRAELAPELAGDRADKKDDAEHKRKVAGVVADFRAPIAKSIKGMIGRDSRDKVVERVRERMAAHGVDPVVVQDAAIAIVDDAIAKNNAQMVGRNVQRSGRGGGAVNAGRAAGGRVPAIRGGAAVDVAPRAVLPPIQAPRLEIAPGALAPGGKDQAALREAVGELKQINRGVAKMTDGVPAVLS